MSFRGGGLFGRRGGGGLNGRGAYIKLCKNLVCKIIKTTISRQTQHIFLKVIKTNTNRSQYHYGLLCPRLRSSLKARVNHFVR